MYCNSIINDWKEGLISTGEALTRILINDLDDMNGKLCALADLAVNLTEQEEREAAQFAEEAFIETNFFNFTEHVRAYYIKDLPDDEDEFSERESGG